MTLDITKLQRLFVPSMIDQLENVLFYRDDDGTYNLFEEYSITPQTDYYVVCKHGNKIEHQFSTLKYALSYCISSRRNRIQTMRNIIEYDQKLCSLDVEIKIQRSLLNSVDSDLYKVKLNENMLKRNSVYRRLQDIVRECNVWQSSKFGRSLNSHEE